jgi:cytochrome c-type biogenesis protein CcmH/NrfG
MALDGTASFAVVAAALAFVAAWFVAPLPWPRLARGAVAGQEAGPPQVWRRARWWLALPAAAAALFMAFGDPGALSQQRHQLSARLRDAASPLDPDTAARVHAELQQHLQRHGDDARARVLLARMDLQAQRFEQAAAGYEFVLRGRSKAVGDAGVWVEYAEARAMLQGGTLAGLPRQLVDKALSIDPDHPQALDLAGSAAWEAGEFDLVARHWTRLLAQIDAGSPRHVQLAAAIRRAEQRARFALPPR